MIFTELIDELDNNTEKLFALFAEGECDFVSGTCEMSIGNFKKLKLGLKNIKRVIANARSLIINSQTQTIEDRLEALDRLSIIENTTIDVQYLLSEWNI